MDNRRKISGGTNVTIKSTLHGDIAFSKTEEDLLLALGQFYGDNYSLTIDGYVATLTIPKADEGSWIGKRGCVVSTLSTILKVNKVIVCGKK